MWQVLLRRLVMMVFVLIGISLITFTLSRVVPADAARMIAGPRASKEGVEQVRVEYGLDKPLWQQYVKYMTDLLHGNLGKSFSSLRPVTKDLGEFLFATAELAFISLLLAVVGGITIGVLSAVKQNSLFDVVTRLISILGLSVPAFWLALLAQILFYQRLSWLPFGGRISDGVPLPTMVTGFLTIDSLLAGKWETFRDVIAHLILPAIILALEPMAVLARIQRTSLLDVMREQYILAARAKGLNERAVIFRHGLLNALLPVVTMIGLQIGYLLGGSILVESVFAWPGIGRYSARAIVSADYNGVMGVTLTIAAIYMVSNFLTDMVYTRLDPRIRY